MAAASGGGSRICVKNLPAHVSEAKLKEHFGAKWEVTDAKIMRTRDGESRCFGFVGFRSEEDARSAVKYFDRSFLGTCRLVCEVARAVGDATAVRPWSRHSKGSSAYDKSHKTSSAAAAAAAEAGPQKVPLKEVEDPRLAEFLGVMQPRAKAKLWGNDVQVDSGAHQAAANSDYLKNKVTKHWSDDEASENSDDQNDDADVEEPKHDAVLASEQQSVAETGRLFVRNLAYTASEEDLSDLFGQYGELSQVHLVLDKETNRSKGFAYVLFKLPESAVRALQELDKSIFQGRLVHILPARQPPPVPEKPSVAPTFKQQRESQRKKSEQSGDTKAWNPLYMRSDTVAAYVAKQYGMSKRDFLDPQAEDLAVRSALGETHVIAETKRALTSQGVNVKVLEDIVSGETGQVRRSTHVLVVKHLPFETTEDDLSELFGRYGGLGRLVLPPTRAVAIVEFLEASEARKAFESLAYTRFRHVPLFLEWAPEGLLEARQISEVEDGAAVRVRERVVAQDELLRDEEEVDAAKACSVFVKNLSFKTTEASLKKHFESQLEQGSLRSVTVKTKPSKNGGGKPLSMGFGFLEFDSVHTAQHVCKKMQGTVVDGHALVLHLSSRAGSKVTQPDMKAAKGLSCTKIIVRNVAFEATAKDLKQLFSPFGQMKTLRLPKKFDGKHRGFAFVEFVTKHEAQNAFTSLAGTHLYGRHLVLEWAREGESVEELRARAASSLQEEAPTRKKRRKV